MCPPSPPQMCYGIRGGEDSSKRRAWTNGFTFLPGIHLTSSSREVGSYLSRRGKRDSMGCTNHGWHHEPHSPVTNAMCKRWDTPECDRRYRRVASVSSSSAEGKPIAV